MIGADYQLSASAGRNAGAAADRCRVVAGLERATGGKVELGAFNAVPLLRQVEVRDLTIHGKEAAGEQPYVHVDSMIAVINMSSALGAVLRGPIQPAPMFRNTRA